MIFDLTEHMIITNTGNVGIGTTAPTEKLHVNGNIKVDGNITSNQGTINFNDEHLTTTGNINGNNIEVSAGGITSNQGTINFNDEHLITTGNIKSNQFVVYNTNLYNSVRTAI